MDYLVGVDIGTTHTKAVAYALDGRVLGEHHVGYAMQHPQPGFSELDPDKIYRAVVACIHRVIAQCSEHRLAGIGFSAAMHSLICIDEKGKPLTPCITWADNRAAAIASRLRQNQQQLYHLTGTPIHAMSPLTKLIWLRENAPAIFNRAAIFAGIKEYILFKLTGTWACDFSIASATGLMNLHRREWDPTALQEAGIGSERLPELHSPHHVLFFKKNKQTALPIPDQTPLILGASDGTLAHLGSGAMTPGDISVTIGTSSAIRVFVPEACTDPEMRTFCYLLDEKRTIIGGGANSGGYVLQWLKNNLLQSKMSFEKLYQEASKAPPGCDGLRLKPYLLGERAPWWDEQLTGSFTGIRIGHRREHFIRAAMEGIIFNLSILGQILNEKTPITRIMASGGFTQNALWLQILADVFQTPVHIGQYTDASARGAAMMAGEALKLAPFFDHTTTNIIEPIIANQSIYQAMTN